MVLDDGMMIGHSDFSTLAAKQSRDNTSSVNVPMYVGVKPTAFNVQVMHAA